MTRRQAIGKFTKIKGSKEDHLFQHILTRGDEIGADIWQHGTMVKKLESATGHEDIRVAGIGSASDSCSERPMRFAQTLAAVSPFFF